MPAKVRVDRPRRKGATHSREKILEGARSVIERGGLRALSMPALAREIGSGVTSLYWYFADKDDLLETLTSEVLTEIHQSLPPLGHGPWDEVLVAHFTALRNALTAHTVYRELIAYDLRSVIRRPPVPYQAERIEDGFALLAGQGFNHHQSLAALSALSNYTRGFVVLEMSALDPGDGTESAAANGDANAILDDGFAQLDDEHFAVGLRFMLAGVRAQFSSASDQGEG